MGHLAQKCQGVRSNKPNPPQPSSPDPPQAGSPEEPLPQFQSNELFIQVAPISKLYTDDTGSFQVCDHSVHHCVMIMYHCNVILVL